MADYNYSKLFATIEGLVKSDVPVDQALRRVIEFCRRTHRHAQWDRLAALDVAGDLRSIEQKVATYLRESPPGSGLDGFYFGLCNLAGTDDLSDANTIADMYLTASAYDNDDPDWACATTWRAEGYFDSTYLAAMYGLAYDGKKRELGNRAEYPLALAYGGLLVRHLGKVLTEQLLSGGAERRFLVVGFDSGDFICVGRVDRDGLTFSTQSERFV